MKKTASHPGMKLRNRRPLPKFRPLPVRSLAPNILTVLALCAGLTAINFALGGHFQSAVIAIMVAGVLDGIDGRVARLLDGATRFGAELDSLSDFANFGVAPVTVLYLWSLHDLGGVGWIVVLAFSICCALRLARFNVATEDPDRPVWKRNYFVGVPSPAAALLCLMPFFVGFLGLEAVREWPLILAVYTLFVSFLMVSRVPTFSGKGLKVEREQVLPVLLLVALFASLVLIYPWETLVLCGLAYLVSIPFAGRAYARQSEETRDSAPPFEVPELDADSEVDDYSAGAEAPEPDDESSDPRLL